MKRSTRWILGGVALLVLLTFSGFACLVWMLMELDAQNREPREAPYPVTPAPFSPSARERVTSRLTAAVTAHPELENALSGMSEGESRVLGQLGIPRLSDD